VSYAYNGLGERVSRAGTSGSRYVYDGDDLALEVDPFGNKVREFTYYPGIDQPHSVLEANGAVYYFAMDYLGHVDALINTSGSIVNYYQYSPWGVPEITSEGVSNTIRFMAREFDNATGLYYVRNRWYDPETGRFISEDPIGLAGGINLYSYAGNDPVNKRDPLGLQAEECKVMIFYPTENQDWIVYVWDCPNPDPSGLGRGPRSARGGNPPGGPQDSRGGGLPGVSGGTRQSDAQTSSPMSCSAALGLAGWTVASDLALLTGIGLAAKGLIAARASATTFQWMARDRDPILRSVANYGSVVAASNKALLAAPLYTSAAVGAYAADIPNQTVLAVAAGDDVSLWDFVPIIASYRGIRDAIRAC
jgi:RHS repeat-associated protein